MASIHPGGFAGDDTGFLGTRRHRLECRRTWTAFNALRPSTPCPSTTCGFLNVTPGAVPGDVPMAQMDLRHTPRGRTNMAHGGQGVGPPGHRPQNPGSRRGRPLRYDGHWHRGITWAGAERSGAFNAQAMLEMLRQRPHWGSGDRASKRPATGSSVDKQSPAGGDERAADHCATSRTVVPSAGASRSRLHARPAGAGP